MDDLTMFRREPIRSQKVRDSAKGQVCSARFPGICGGNPETTVWAHLNGHAFGKGAALKAHDIFGFYACFECHVYYDVGHGQRAIIDDVTLLRCILSALAESWLRLIDAGTIMVPRDKPKTFHERETEPRKPKDQRAEVGKNRPLPTGRKLEGRSEWPKGRKIPSRKAAGK